MELERNVKMKKHIENISITIPWPPSTLSPNSRMHWSKVMKCKKSFKNECYIYAMRAIKGSYIPDIYSVSLDIIFKPNNRRRYDIDNLCARIKSGLDGVCKAIRIDDFIIKNMNLKIEPNIGSKESCVIMKFININD